MSEIFDKTKTKSTTKKKKEEIRITIPAENFDKIQQLEKLDKSIKEESAKLEEIKADVRTIALNEWIGNYEQTATNPGTIVVVAEGKDSTAEAMFIVKDAYGKISDKDYKSLVSTYGPEIAEQDVEFVFDKEMLQKYSKVITKLIKETKLIEEEDKSKLFNANVKYSIRSGSINGLIDFSNYGTPEKANESEDNLFDFMDNDEVKEPTDIKKILKDIKPTMSLQGYKVVKN